VDAELANINAYCVVMTAVRWAIGLVTGVLLFSFGGAIFASPLLLALLIWTARDASPIARWSLACLAALVVAESAWALVYVTAGEHSPAIWPVPLVLALVCLRAMTRSVGPFPRRHRSIA
jgi:hypothetical protein